METALPLQQLVDQGILSFDGQRYRLTEPVASYYKNSQLEQRFLEPTLKFFQGLKNADYVELEILETLQNKLRSLGATVPINCSSNLKELVTLGIVEFDGQRYRLTREISCLISSSSLSLSFLPKVLTYFEKLKTNNKQKFISEEKTLETLKSQAYSEQLDKLVTLGLVEFVDNRYKLKQELRKFTRRSPLFPSSLAATLSYFVSQISTQPKEFLSQESRTVKILIYEGKKAGLNNLVQKLQQEINNKTTIPPQSQKLPSPKTNQSLHNLLPLFQTFCSGLIGVLIGSFLLPHRQPCKLTNAPFLTPAPRGNILVPETPPIAPKENVNITLPQPSNTTKTSPSIKLSIQVRNKQNNPAKPQQKSAPVSQAKPSANLQNPPLKQVPVVQAKPSPTPLNPALEQVPTEEINADILHLY
jgi:hypothetical protein